MERILFCQVAQKTTSRYDASSLGFFLPRRMHVAYPTWHHQPIPCIAYGGHQDLLPSYCSNGMFYFTLSECSQIVPEINVSYNVTISHFIFFFSFICWVVFCGR